MAVTDRGIRFIGDSRVLVTVTECHSLTGALSHCSAADRLR